VTGTVTDTPTTVTVTKEPSARPSHWDKNQQILKGDDNTSEIGARLAKGPSSQDIEEEAARKESEPKTRQRTRTGKAARKRRALERAMKKQEKDVDGAHMDIPETQVDDKLVWTDTVRERHKELTRIISDWLDMLVVFGYL
jgi:hypothetical protein